MARTCGLRFCLLPAPPLCPRRAEQLSGVAPEGRMSEPAGEFAAFPRWASSAGDLERSGRSRAPGSPFFCLRFFGGAKKSRSAAGPRPGLLVEHLCDAKKPCPSPLATQRCSVKQQVFTVTLEILRTAATRWPLLNASFECQHVSQLFLPCCRRAAHSTRRAFQGLK